MRRLSALLFTLVFVAPLMGQSEFEANSSFTAEILSAGSGVTFTWEVFPGSESAFTQGPSTAFADTSNEASAMVLAIGDFFDLFAVASGTADAGGISEPFGFGGGISDSFGIGGGLLLVENTSDSPQEFSIDVEWSLVADASVGDIMFQEAFGTSNVNIFLDLDAELLFETAESSAFLEDGRVELGDSLTIEIELEPGEIAELDFLVDALGIALDFSVVPEPTIPGDVNMDGVVDFFDIQPFIEVLTAQTFQAEADIDGNGVVDFFDIQPFINILSGP